MLLTKADLEVVRAASTELHRHNLQAIHITDTHVEATDGHWLARVATKPFAEVLEYPDVDCEADPNAQIPENVLVSVDAVKKLMKQLPPKTLTAEVLRESCVLDVPALIASEGKKARFIYTDLEQEGKLAVDTVEGCVPDIDQVIPRDTPTVTVCVDASLLKRVCELVIAHRGRNQAFVMLSIPGSSFGQDKGSKQRTANVVGPLRFDWMADGVRRALAVLMPARMDMDLTAAYAENAKRPADATPPKATDESEVAGEEPGDEA